MKKLFFILVAFIALGAFAQEIGRYGGVFFAVSEEGDSIYYGEDDSTARVNPIDENVANFRCYQGPDR